MDIMPSSAGAPPTTDAVIGRIRAWMRASGLSAEAMAARAGIAGNTLRGIHDAGWQPSVKTLRKLEAVIPAGWQAGDAVAPTPGAETGDPEAGAAA